MIPRLDRLMTDLPIPDGPSPNGAVAVQELLGGKFIEMSTLMNCTFQWFNMRGPAEVCPFYDLIANIAAEEFAHIELEAGPQRIAPVAPDAQDLDPEIITHHAKKILGPEVAGLATQRARSSY